MTSITDHPVRHPNAGVMVNIDPGADVLAALGQADLMWGVVKAPIRATLADGRDPILIPDRAAILRDRGPLEDPTPLGVTGAGYIPITNFDAYRPLDALIDLGRIRIVQGGQTKNGRHTFLLCELTDGTTMLDVDPHKRFILARTSHDGTGALTLTAWSQRLWCTNQIPGIVARRAGQAPALVSIRHGHGASTRVESLPKMLTMLVGSLDNFDEAWQALASRYITPREVNVFLHGLFPDPVGPNVTERMWDTVSTRRNEVKALLDSPTNANLAGRRASLVAAATEWDQWFRGKSVERRSARILEGRSTAFTQKAWALASGAL